MSVLDSLEDKLNKMFVTNAPVTLPEEWRKWMATYAWVFSLVGFILGIFATLVLVLDLGVSTGLSVVVGLGPVWIFAWVAILVLSGYVLLLGLATSRLKRMEKSGWKMIFYASLLFTAYVIFSWLYHMTLGTTLSLIWNLAWITIAVFFVFQIRSFFDGAKPKKTTKKTKKH